MSFEQLKQIWNIMRLRSGPQVLAYSYGLLLVFFLLHMLIDIALSVQSGLQWPNLLGAMVNTLFTAAFVFAILQVAKKAQRFVQTLLALLGIEILIGVIGMLLLFMYQIPALALLVSVLYLFLIVWNGLVAAHIFHHALDASMLWGVVLALLYIFLSYNVIVAISGVASGV